jgi:glutamate dehydrogenase (NADP+)
LIIRKLKGGFFVTINVQEFMDNLIAQNPAEPEFHQAVKEVVISLAPFIDKNPKYAENKILERLVEPERTISFRVPWVDDKGEIQVNKGWRVQFNSAIGPYKGGLRFAPNVTVGTLKFLGFEQIFKNSLTNLPLGGGKGGSNFDGRGKSDAEVMRFCQSFMTELFRHIGPNTDVPAGDIGVGGREIGYLFGQYKRLANEYTGVLTGKGVGWGGSLIRTQATGYGVAYFLQQMLATKGMSIEGQRVAASGYGNVGSFFIEKVHQLGGKIITVADPFGYVYDPDGVSGEKLEYIKTLWTVYRRPIKDYAEKYGLEYKEGSPWVVPCDIAVPTSRQNELDLNDAKALLNNGVKCVCEAANMPCSEDAVNCFLDAKILFAPGKAANAGGVGVSGLEMAQNSMRYYWSAEEVDAKLKTIMENIHATCQEYGKEGSYTNYVDGANIGGFIKIADAMIAQGVV